MVLFRAGAERRQAFLFRLVDIANELLAMSASVARADALARTGRPEAAQANRLADHFCIAARRKVRGLFRALWRNDDAAAYAMGREVLAGKHEWLEQGGIGLGLTVEELKPKQAAPAPPHREEKRAAPRPAGVA
jgi:hypothetical protein